MLAKIDDENREYIKKNLLKPTYENFINSVASNRGLKVEELKPFTQGKIFIANMPEIKGILVDKISSLYRVKKMIKESLKDDKIAFEDIKLDKKNSFLPEVKLDLNLKELIDRIYIK